MDSVQRILKSSSTVENMVAELVGKTMTQEDEPAPPTLVDSSAFQYFIYGTILLNTLTLGLQADLNGGGWDTTWLVLENIFTAVFAGEMVAKLLFMKWGYFWNAKMKCPQYWNLLDFVIAWLAIVDCWVLTFQQNTDAPLIRVMQLLRIIRIAKLLRLREELVAIIEGLFSSLQCMVWIGFLLMIVIYAFSIVCRNIMGNLSNSDYEDSINNEMHFGSLPRTMLTLFNICLIDSWSQIIWPQMLYNPWMVMPLIIFMCVTCFGLMNALIGVIVERTTAAQQNVSTLQEEAVREMKMYMVAQLLDAIDASDEDKSGTINLQEFRQVQRKPHAAQIFSALNLPPGFEAKDLFSLLDSDGNGVLDRYEFLLGICRLIWCDEFQSQCLLNFTLSQVRQDIRSLQSSVRDLAQKTTCSEQALAAVSRNIRRDVQEALESSLEGWRQVVAKGEVRPLDLDQTQVLFPAHAREHPRAEGVMAEPLPPREAGTVGTAEVPEFFIQLPAELLEAAERHLEELSSTSGARRLQLRADGLLLVGSSHAHERLQALLAELGGDSDLEVQPEGQDNKAVATKRRKCRRKKAKAPEAEPGLP